jgi:hypothetical protein
MSLFAGRHVAPLCVLALLLVGFGCARTSPYVGTWSATGFGTQTTLTLRPDGKGTITLPANAGGAQPINWTEKDDVLTLTPANDSSTATASRRGMSITGSLASDKKSLNISVTLAAGAPAIPVTMQKQAGAN